MSRSSSQFKVYNLFLIRFYTTRRRRLPGRPRWRRSRRFPSRRWPRWVRRPWRIWRQGWPERKGRPKRWWSRQRRRWQVRHHRASPSRRSFHRSRQRRCPRDAEPLPRRLGLRREAGLRRGPGDERCQRHCRSCRCCRRCQDRIQSLESLQVHVADYNFQHAMSVTVVRLLEQLLNTRNRVLLSLTKRW